LGDFEKVSQVQIRSISNEPTVKSDKEIKAVRERYQKWRLDMVLVGEFK